MLSYWLARGGVGEDGGDLGDVGGNVRGGWDGNCGMHCIIKLTALLGEAQVHPSSPAWGGEIKGLLPNHLIPL